MDSVREQELLCELKILIDTPETPSSTTYIVEQILLIVFW
jgi:hypothetical protein